MYTSKCVNQNCYIKLLFKYLKVQGLTNVCVFDLFTLWLHFKFGRTLIETWYTHVVFVACSSMVGLHICILNYFSLICILIFCNSLLINHVFLCITLRLQGLLFFFFYKVSLFFVCVGLNLRHNAYTCRYSLCRSKCRQEHEAFIDTTTSSPFEFWVVYSRTEHVYCIEC